MSIYSALLQNPEVLAQLMGRMGQGQVPPGIGGPISRPPHMPIQRPQMGQPPPFLPSAPGFNPQMGPGGTAPGNMPFIRNAAMSQVLSPLMQQNYGLPMISPFGQQAPTNPGLGQPLPGLRIPSRVGIGAGIPRAFSG